MKNTMSTSAFNKLRMGYSSKWCMPNGGKLKNGQSAWPTRHAVKKEDKKEEEK